MKAELKWLFPNLTLLYLSIDFTAGSHALHPAGHMASDFLWGGSSRTTNRELKPNILTKQHPMQTILFYYQLQSLLIYQTRSKWYKYINKYHNRHTSHEENAKHDTVYFVVFSDQKLEKRNTAFY